MNFEKFWDEVQEILKEPKSAFEKISKEKFGKKAIYYLAFLLVLGSLMRTLTDVFIQPYISEFIAKLLQIQFERPEFTIDTAFYYIIVSTIAVVFIIGPIYTVITTVILHVWTKIFGGKGNLKDSAKLYIYAITPGYLLGWIPVLGSLSWFYVVYLLIIGSQKINGLSKRKATLIFGVPFALAIVVTIIGIISTVSILQNTQ